MKYLLTISVAFFVSACSIQPGVTIPAQKNIDQYRMYTAVEKVKPSLDIQIDPTIAKVYQLEVEISRFASGSKQVTEKSIMDKFQLKFENVLGMVLAEKDVPAEAWDALVRMGIILSYDEVESILANLELAVNEGTYANNLKPFPIVDGYLGKLYPGWPSVDIAKSIVSGFQIHDESEANLTRNIFHVIKQARIEYPKFSFMFLGGENMSTFLYAARYTIKKHEDGKSIYPEPLDLVLSQEDRVKWVKAHLQKYKQLIRGGGA